MTDHTTNNVYPTCAGSLRRKPHRQLCTICQGVCRVDFLVSDEIWYAAMPKPHWNDPVCINCFTHNAEERGVEWCKDIELTPCSRMRYERETWHSVHLTAEEIDERNIARAALTPPDAEGGE